MGLGEALDNRAMSYPLDTLGHARHSLKVAFGCNEQPGVIDRIEAKIREFEDALYPTHTLEEARNSALMARRDYAPLEVRNRIDAEVVKLEHDDGVNILKEPVKRFEDTFSAMTVVKEAFFSRTDRVSVWLTHAEVRAALVRAAVLKAPAGQTDGRIAEFDIEMGDVHVEFVVPAPPPAPVVWNARLAPDPHFPVFRKWVNWVWVAHGGPLLIAYFIRPHWLWSSVFSNHPYMRRERAGIRAAGRAPNHIRAIFVDSQPRCTQ